MLLQYPCGLLQYMTIAIVKISQSLPLEQRWLQEYQQKMLPWGNILPLMAYMGGLRPKGVPFFRPQEYPDKRVRISLTEVYQRVGKSLSFWSVKGPKKGLTDTFFCCEDVKYISRLR